VRRQKSVNFVKKQEASGSVEQASPPASLKMYGQKGFGVGGEKQGNGGRSTAIVLNNPKQKDVLNQSS